MSTLVRTKPKVSVKVQTLATVGALAAAVALPQVFHAVGAVSGLGTALGETFLPMHLPILLVGLTAGPAAGAISGVLAPLVSFALSGMPTAAMLPFMMIELLCYGLFAGLMRTARIPSLGKVVLAQIGGRAVRAAAILIAFYGLGSTAIPVAIIWRSIATRLPGLLLQWALLPLLLYWIENRSHKADA